MATHVLPDQPAAASSGPRRREQTWGDTLRRWLAPLASLRLTVALMAMAIFLIFAGTLAQVGKDIWEVMGLYFRTPIAWIEWQVFFPPAFFPSRPHVPGSFPFPGGFLIGSAMAVNLLAAHGVRFKIQARGARLAWGLVILAIGGALAWVVVMGGNDREAIEGGAAADWSGLWTAIKLSLLVFVAAASYGFVRLERGRHFERFLLGSAVVLLGTLSFWLWMQGSAAELGGPGMRILWQLIKALSASAIMLTGCVLAFRKRAGIVLLHAGIGLMMANELVVYGLHSEGQVRLAEGDTTNFVEDIRKFELAVVDPTPAKADHVVVVPGSLLNSSLESSATIADARLPFRVRVIEYYKNAALKDALPAFAGSKNRATAGAGRHLVAERLRPGAGTDTDSKVDAPAAYVELLDKQGGAALGTYLLSLNLRPQKVAVAGKTYDLAMRFKRSYRPYTLRLDDVRGDRYAGTALFKNYSSDLHLVDPTRHVDRDVKIWMNNPLRFAGETFYQSMFSVDPQTGQENTTLQVVKNTGWMLPYLCCVMVGLGMLAHFLITLVRFLEKADKRLVPVEGVVETPPASVARRGATGRSRRREASKPSEASEPIGITPSGAGWRPWLAPLVVFSIGAVWVASQAMPHKTTGGSMRLEDFGRLPLKAEGRVKPFDTLARTTLRMLSDRQTFIEETKISDDEAKAKAGRHPAIRWLLSWLSDPDSKIKETRQPAVKWLLDVITDSDAMRGHKVFRIENLDLLEMLGLERRPGLRYSINELKPKLDVLQQQAELVTKVDPEKLSLLQKKTLELLRKIDMIRILKRSFERPSIRTDSPENFKTDMLAAIREQQDLAKANPPLAAPPATAEEEWQPYSTAWAMAFAKLNFMGERPTPSILKLDALLIAYSHGDAEKFNRTLDEYQEVLAAHPPEEYTPRRTRFEEFFNQFSPFYIALAIYALAGVLEALSWLGWSLPLSRSSTALVLLALAVHTFAIIARIYISQRPPVTNLYATAVFIGWGCVVLGLILEWVYRLGIGNVVASVMGFATLLIAHFLSTGGDTFQQLEAVLNTQFWLATHVTCVTLGYATTFVAGMLGIIYILRGVFSRALSPEISKDISRMIYGTVCFAILFSFVGTVLGGLWADDSWGRFWGWDPKENGALIIVLWNALVLHARWGGMVRERGLAALVVVGNIVTSWSWFGVNELGVGLHSYGFTEGVLLALGLFIVSQLAIIGLALLPSQKWGSAQNAAV